jgi:hypothetical protein
MLRSTQPLEQPYRTISGVGRKPLWSKLEASPNTLQHGLGDSYLLNAIGACTLGVDDDPRFIVDQVVCVISKQRVGTLPGNPGRLRIGQ